MNKNLEKEMKILITNIKYQLLHLKKIHVRAALLNPLKNMNIQIQKQSQQLKLTKYRILSYNKIIYILIDIKQNLQFEKEQYQNIVKCLF